MWTIFIFCETMDAYFQSKRKYEISISPLLKLHVNVFYDILLFAL